MFSRYLFLCRERLTTSIFNLLLPGSFCNLSVGLGIGIDGLSKVGKEAFRPFVSEVFGMPKGKLSPLLRMINQGAVSEIVLREGLPGTDLPEEG
jgi:hypothetical protein